MSNPPSFLPPMLCLSGTWENIVTVLYNVFTRDFVLTTPRYRSRLVVYDQRRSDSNREEGFWHLVTKKQEGQRLVDFRRAERLPWARPLIEHPHDPAVTEFQYKEGSGRRRIYLWLAEWDYVLILEKRSRNRVFIVTAFYVEGTFTRENLKRKYANREKQSPPE
jgi:hypothetical protein